MGFDYALVHLIYTIPPALAFTYICRPLLHRIDVYKILFLITIAVVSTIPWDSYLIRRKIWTYPSNVIIGPKLFSIPLEEIFFFVIQTYNTTLIYLLLSKPIFHSSYLVGRAKNAPIPFQNTRTIGQLILGSLIATGGFLVWLDEKGTYLGLILVWAAPFALLIWSLSYQFLIGLPLTSTLAPIIAPTLYLWLVDTLALRRGTWAIESGTKLGLQLWHGLDVEEAVFFLATNTLIVFGLVAFDNALAILLTFPTLFPVVPALPSPVMLVQALLTSTSEYDVCRISGIQQAVNRLRRKSRSFYLASSVFYGRVRIDLILLYSFCRVADDLIDDAKTETEAREWINKLTHFLDLRYKNKEPKMITKHLCAHSFITQNFPSSSQAALSLLPTSILSSGPLYGLLEGFKTELEFHQGGSGSTGGFSPRAFPISDEGDLSTYSTRVAGTIAEMCLELIYHHCSTTVPSAKRDHLVRAGARMGIALQYVNIARDVMTDAAIGRVYLPTSWLEEEFLKPEAVLRNPSGPAIDKIRGRLLEKAFGIYREARPAIEQIPGEFRAPMRVVVESYMEIGRVMKERKYIVKRGEATVPRWRRIRVAWKALSCG